MSHFGISYVEYFSFAIKVSVIFHDYDDDDDDDLTT
jgi:hypothetical protein